MGLSDTRKGYLISPMRASPNSHQCYNPMPQKHYCEDCEKEIITPEDEMSYFDHDRCQSCEKEMFRYMADLDEADRLAKKTT